MTLNLCDIWTAGPHLFRGVAQIPWKNNKLARISQYQQVTIMDADLTTRLLCR